MELSIREWLVIVGVLLIIAVMLDGYRRMRDDRRGKIKMSLKKQSYDDNIDEEPSSTELPNGGARVVSANRENPADKEFTPDESFTAKAEEPQLDDSQSQEPHEKVEVEAKSESAKTETVNKQPEPEPVSQQKAESSTESNLVPDKQMLVMNVMAKSGEKFSGSELLQILLACDVRFGDMNIFHRYEKSGGSGSVQFSVANIVEPGVFDLDAIEQFSTPGVVFFMSLPGPEDSMMAFDYMVETAQCLAKNLGGELRDESHSTMTTQILEDCRHRIMEYERRRLAHSS